MTCTLYGLSTSYKVTTMQWEQSIRNSSYPGDCCAIHVPKDIESHT